MGGTILSIYDAIKYNKDFQVKIQFADEYFLLELINLPELPQEGVVFTVYELKKMLSDKLFGISSFDDSLFVNVEFLNGKSSQQKSIILSLNPMKDKEIEGNVFLWSEISFLPLIDTPNPFLKNILLFENYHNGKNKS